MRGSRTICTLILLLSAYPAGAVGPYRWTAECVDPDALGGLNSSVGAVHPDEGWSVAYPVPVDGGWELRFALEGSAGWSYETVDTAASEIRHPTVAVDGGGRVCVAYGAGSQLRYAVRIGPDDWMVEPVSSVTKSVLFASLAFGLDGDPAIAFTDGTLFGGGVSACLVVREGDAWVVREIGDPDLERPYGTSLAALPDGRLCVSYNDFAGGMQRLAVAIWDGVDWSIETLLDLPYRDPSATDVAVSPDGRLCIAYWNAYRTSGAVGLATRVAPGLWDDEVIDPLWSGFLVCPAIAFAPDGEPWVSYNSQTGARVAARRDGTWTVWGILLADAPATSTQLGFTRAGLPEVIANGGEADGGIYRIAGAPTPWRLAIPDRAVPGHSYVASAAYVSGLHPAVAYVDSGTGEVRAALRSEDEWIVTVVDGPGVEFEAPVIAAGPGGEIWISYHDEDHAQLRAAHWNGYGWDPTVVLEDHIGTSSCGAFDPSVTYHIAFWSRSDGGFPIRLYYATWTGSAWEVELAAEDIPCPAADIGLAFDEQDLPWIFWSDG